MLKYCFKNYLTHNGKSDTIIFAADSILKGSNIFKIFGIRGADMWLMKQLHEKGKKHDCIEAGIYKRYVK